MVSPEGSLFPLLHAPMRPGIVVWIGVRPERRGAVLAVGSAVLDPAAGLGGDHYSNRGTRTRQVTLIGREALAAIGGFLGQAPVAAELVRRNVVVAGINLHALKSLEVRLGSAVLLVTGECYPCSRMEEVLGVGGYNAVRGHGGVTARIVQGGTVSVGDAVVRVA